MTDQSTSGSQQDSSAPQPWQIRAELEKLIVGDLHGPAQGDDEVLPGRGRVRDRYLVGMLAPRGTIATSPDRSERLESAGDDIPGEETVSDQGATGTTDLYPTSIGLSCVVDARTDTLRVTAAWGRYVKEGDETQEKREPGTRGAGGQGSTVWRRHPMEGVVTLDLRAAEAREGRFPDERPVDACPDVVVRGRVRRVGDCRLVTLFLVNGQEQPPRNKDEAWLFQVFLAVESPDGAPVFVGRHDVLSGDRGLTGTEYPEIARLDMLYRDHVEFAVGHGVGVHAYPSAQNPQRATRVETAVIPGYEVPLTEAPDTDDDTLSPTVRDPLGRVTLDMKTLAHTTGAGLGQALTPLVDAYEQWLREQAARLDDPGSRLEPHPDAAREALREASECAARLRAGITVLARDADAAEAFRFANRAMWRQRVHSVAVTRARTDERPFGEILAAVDAEPANYRWRPFQLAFLVLNVPSLTDLTHPERAASPDEGLVDLLFFPTGGGKTEAYLGLAAFTMAIRRLQGTVAGHDGRAGGVAVLMRYTLRLLTAQQFQRAAALVCACELARRELLEHDERWGDTPFRLGMWVGSSVTPNWFQDAQYAIQDARGQDGYRGGRASPLQLVSCPWCGTSLDLATSVRSDAERRRVIIACSDPMGECPFTEARSPGEGLPVVTVDEEMYRLLPAFIIATADKFAQLPWQGPLHLLFGKVRRLCTRHGYRSPDLDNSTDFTETDSHRKIGSLPAARTIDVPPLRPPDLIIQDELHLITGPLGTMVGLYETAIDHLATWQVDGRSVRPKVVASTATIRRAAEQAHALFYRGLRVFPPQVLDVGDSFFARQRPTEGDRARLGRRYLGVCGHGRSLKEVEVRVFTTLLAAAQTLFDRYGGAADPWMTCVGYFNSLRELGGAKRLVDDEVSNRVKMTDRRGLARRNRPLVRELTSRIASTDIPGVLDQLEVAHDPVRIQAKLDKQLDDYFPVDVLLATNMISVGVDVPRLGLMAVVGQPKTTAEYIQATSRVGRSQGGPGLVVTIYNWARPRDLSHYETFEQYHATFYRHVEALSVTPFSPRALDRGLTAVLVALVRHSGMEWKWNPNSGAMEFDTLDPRLEALLAYVAERGEDVAGVAGVAAEVTRELRVRLGEWGRLQGEKRSAGARLGYSENRSASAAAVALLRIPESVEWDRFTCPHSLRETEPNIQLILSDDDPLGGMDRPFELGTGQPDGVPAVTPAADEDLDQHDAEAFA